jgi:radical SAM-linked protein
VWYRLTFAKVDEARWLSHLEMVAAFYRSLRRSGLPLAFSAGFHPLPRVAFHGALPVGVASLAETLDLALTANLDQGELLAQLNQVLPTGLNILSVQHLQGKQKPPQVEAALYRVGSPEPVFDADRVVHFLAQEEVWVPRQRPKQVKMVEVRRLVTHLEVANPQEAHLTLGVSERDNLKVTEVIAAVFGLDADQGAALEIMKIQSSTGRNFGKPRTEQSPTHG